MNMPTLAVKPLMYLKLCFLTIFATCFFIQVHDQVLKFAKRQTLIVHEFKRDKGLNFPPFAICPHPGFNSENMRHFNIPSSQWSYVSPRPLSSSPSSFRTPKSVSEADELFEASTYSTGELIESIQMEVINSADGSGLKTEQLFRDGQVMGNWSELVEVLEMTSPPFGKCQIIIIKVPITNRAEDIKAILRYPSGVDHLNIYVFEHGLEIFGIMLNFWLAHFQSFRLYQGYEATLGLDKIVKLLSPEKTKCAEENDDNIAGEKVTATQQYYQCIFKKTLSGIKRDNMRLCYWPTMKPFVLGRPVCNSSHEVQQTFKAIVKGPFPAAAFSTNTDCRPSCHAIDFRFQSRFTPDPGGDDWNGSVFYLYYNQIEVEHSQETVLYDFNDIVAAVGGSLGLFLGFSFLGAVVSATDWIKASYVAWRSDSD